MQARPRHGRIAAHGRHPGGRATTTEKNMTRSDYHFDGPAFAQAVYHTGPHSGRAYYRVSNLTHDSWKGWPFGRGAGSGVGYDHGSHDPAGLAVEVAIAAHAFRRHLGSGNGAPDAYRVGPVYGWPWILSGSSASARTAVLSCAWRDTPPPPEHRARLCGLLAALQAMPANADTDSDLVALAVARSSGHFPERELARWHRRIVEVRP